jgi:hypothetical protein
MKEKINGCVVHVECGLVRELRPLCRFYELNGPIDSGSCRYWQAPECTCDVAIACAVDIEPPVPTGNSTAKPKRAYNRKAKTIKENPPSPLKNKGEKTTKKHGGWPKGVTRAGMEHNKKAKAEKPTGQGKGKMASAAEADARIREMERADKESVMRPRKLE